MSKVRIRNALLASVLVGSLLLSACARSEMKPEERMKAAADALAATESVEIESELNFVSEIEKNGLAEDMTIASHSYGQMHMSPYTAQWEAAVSFDGLSGSQKWQYETFTMTVQDEERQFIRSASDTEWLQVAGNTYLKDDPKMTNVISAIELNDERQQSEDLIIGTIRGDALREVIEMTLNRNGQFDFSNIQWDSSTAPVELHLDADNRATRLTVYAENIAEGVAEAMAQRLGIKISVTEFRIDIDFGMYNRLKSLPVPDELSGESGELF